jgi:serine/threonine protein kinase
MDEFVGKSIGRYRIVAMVGQGGMATVYRGEDLRLHTVVAVKVMHAHLAANPSFVGRFQREAHLGATLRHPNIARVLDFDTFVGARYLVMEYIDRPTMESVLTDHARGGGHLPLDEVLRVFAALGSAVDYAHQRGMIHRDIKPTDAWCSSGWRPTDRPARKDRSGGPAPAAPSRSSRCGRWSGPEHPRDCKHRRA